MMMRDGRDSGLRENFRHRQTQRHVHRNGEDILGNQELEIKAFHEPIDARLESRLDFVNAVRHFSRARRSAKKIPLDIQDRGVIEKCERIRVAERLRFVDQTGHPEAVRSLRLKDGRPFRRLQGYPVRAVKTGRDKSNALWKMGRRVTKIHGFLQLDFSVRLYG